VGEFLGDVLIVSCVLLLFVLLIIIALSVFFGIQLSEIGIKGFTSLGILLIIVAIIMPFGIRDYFKSRVKNYETIAELGPIGDFIGGTTVAFLTAASVFLLLATIIMQRKEIKISQESIKQLVKQTEASVEQAEESRKEAQITNETMKKQQFETTFFNMINLHHNILNEVKVEHLTGRAAIEKLYEDLANRYNSSVYDEYVEDLIERALAGDEKQLDDLARQVYMDYELSFYISEFEQYFSPNIDEDGEVDTTEYDSFFESIENGTNKDWNSREKQHLLDYEQHIKGNKEEYKNILNRVNFKYFNANLSNEYIDIFNEEFINNPKTELKIRAYEEVYKEFENEIGHYYRNLYRLVKLIQSEKFHSDEKLDELEKRKYRGILRAQLSSFELLMIFYNVVYSKKGEKFKDILRSTNFFDDHLIIDDFIWANDIQVLSNLDKPQE
jgi:hypothetical protein